MLSKLSIMYALLGLSVKPPHACGRSALRYWLRFLPLVGRLSSMATLA